MKIQISVLIALLISTAAYAQEPVRQKEVGLIFTGLNNFGVTFRTGKVNSLWRFSGLNLSGSNQDITSATTVSNSTNNGFDFRVGKEFRKPISESLVLRYGLDGSFSYSKTESEVTSTNQDFYSKRVSYGPGVNLIVGLNYKISKYILIGAELLPSIQYFTGTQKERNNSTETTSDISSLSYGFSNTSAVLSLVYQF